MGKQDQKQNTKVEDKVVTIDPNAAQDPTTPPVTAPPNNEGPDGSGEKEEVSERGEDQQSNDKNPETNPTQEELERAASTSSLAEAMRQQNAATATIDVPVDGAADPGAPPLPTEEELALAAVNGHAKTDDDVVIPQTWPEGQAAGTPEVKSEPATPATIPARGQTTATTPVDELGYHTFAGDSGVSGGIVNESPFKHSYPDRSLNAPAAAEEKPVQVVPSIPEHVTTTGHMILRNLDAYIDAMHPRKTQTEAQLNQHQVSLFRQLILAINKLDNDFETVFGLILQKFNENKDGVFDHVNVFRGMPFIALQPDEIKAFQQILDLVIMTASPKGRHISLQQVSPLKSLSIGAVITDAGRNKVMAFYNV